MTGHKKIKLMGRDMRLPRTKIARIAVGIALVFGGILGFLPVLGFWMIPLGLLVLSHDLAPVRRWRRRLAVRFAGNRNGDARGGRSPQREKRRN